MKKYALIVLLLLLGALAQAQTTRYVTDQLRLEARTGPGTGFRIVRMLESGTKVTVVEEKDGYSRIQFGNGSAAWILSRYLNNEPSARNQVASAKSELTTALEENAQLKATLSESQSKGSATEKARGELNQTNRRLTKELTQIRRTAASTLAIEQENQELQVKVVNLERDLQLAQQENMSLSDNSDRDWFVAGSLVLFGGMLLGVLIPRVRWKKRRGWGEL